MANMTNPVNLNTKIRLRYDVHTAWETANPYLLSGEIAVVSVPKENNGKPDTLFKVGPGNYNDLTFASAIAADVLASAKNEATFAEQIANYLGFTTWSWENANSIILDLAAFLTDDVVGRINSGELTLEDYIEEIVKSRFEAVEGRATALEAAVEKLNGADTVEGSVAKAVKDAVDAHAETAAATYVDKTSYAADKEALNTTIGAIEDNIDAIEEDLGSVDSLSTTNKSVVGAINEVLAAVGTGGTAAVVTMEKSADGLSYTLKQGEATIGTINIPKDMVVQAGEVVTNPDGQAEGTYIKLTLANVDEPLFVNVGSLVDIYKAKANATQVQIAIDSATREVSATIVAGSITSTELADNSVITAKIADANVTKAKLSTAVQASLDKADSAVQSIATGAANGTIAVDGSDVAVKGLGSAAYTDATAYATAAQGEKADTAVQPGVLTETLNNYYTKTAADAEFTNATEVDGQIDAKIAALNLAGTYATVAQGAKADSAIQEVKAVEGSGLKVTAANNVATIGWDETVTLIFNCGGAAEV